MCVHVNEFVSCKVQTLRKPAHSFRDQHWAVPPATAAVESRLSQCPEPIRQISPSSQELRAVAPWLELLYTELLQNNDFVARDLSIDGW